MATYATPVGAFNNWDDAAAACEASDFDPAACIEVIDRREWTVEVLQATPSLNMDRYTFNGTYPEVVQYARQHYSQTGRTVNVHRGKYATYWYFRIDANGTEYDRNLNDGVLATENAGPFDRSGEWTSAGEWLPVGERQFPGFE